MSKLPDLPEWENNKPIFVVEEWVYLHGNNWIRVLTRRYERKNHVTQFLRAQTEKTCKKHGLPLRYRVLHYAGNAVDITDYWLRDAEEINADSTYQT